MPILIVLTLLVAAAIWFWSGSRVPSVRRNPCDWQPTGFRTGPMHEFNCAHCGIKGFGKDGKVPTVCKRGLGR
ncbi:hypothetical protein [Jannaschia pohangensis]|uniref:Uncharacterized protein n=1 Tax=Jannaschia pohangensis TaxID=390807 RepID=A0A1I3Q191_9RHOB|nr:hypothetical protein [Jannaschia pohangensis]SFJ26946.1 hypothetical protein SAMN04488095_2361 [Jannaschia pohangensis]